MTATGHILVSRFPGHVTPGALPIRPELVSIHRDLLHPGRWIVFRWFDAGGEYPEQAPPEFYETLSEAWFRVPTGYVAEPAAPGDFAHLAYRRRPSESGL